MQRWQEDGSNGSIPAARVAIASSTADILAVAAEFDMPLKLSFPLLATCRGGNLAIQHGAAAALVEACPDQATLDNLFLQHPDLAQDAATGLPLKDDQRRFLSGCALLVGITSDRARLPSVVAAVSAGDSHGLLARTLRAAVADISQADSGPLASERLLGVLSIVSALLGTSAGSQAISRSGMVSRT